MKRRIGSAMLRYWRHLERRGPMTRYQLIKDMNEGTRSSRIAYGYAVCDRMVRAGMATRDETNAQGFPLLTARPRMEWDSDY